MSRRHDIQEATGRIEYLSGRGTVEAWGAGAPINGATGFAPGCIWHNVTGGANTSLYVNEGTFTSATWVAVLTQGTTGDDTFGTLTVTTLLRGGTSGLTINAAAGAAGNATIGQSTDSIYLGNASAFGNASTMLNGAGATPSNSSATFAQVGSGSGNQWYAASTVTGGIGPTAYTVADIVYFLKVKGLLKA